MAGMRARNVLMVYPRFVADSFFNFRAACRIHFQAAFFGSGEERRVGDRLVEGVAQDLQAIRG